MEIKVLGPSCPKCKMLAGRVGAAAKTLGEEVPVLIGLVNVSLYFQKRYYVPARCKVAGLSRS